MKDMIEPDGEGRAPHGRQIDGRHVLAGLLGFFAVVLAVNIVFLVSALKTHTGVVAVEPYRKGLAYNERIAAGERQAALGWHDAVVLQPGGTIDIRMTGPDGAPLTGLTLRGQFGRPATARGDQDLVFAEVAAGSYRAVAGAIEAGTWMLAFEVRGVSVDNPLYRAKRRLWLKS